MLDPAVFGRRRERANAVLQFSQGNTTMKTQDLKSKLTEVAGTAKKGGHRIEETMQKAGHKVEEVAGKVVHTAQEAAKKVAHRTEEAGKKAENKARET